MADKNVLRAMIVVAALATPAHAQIVEKPMAFEVVSLKVAPQMDMSEVIRDPGSILARAQALALKVDGGFVSAEGVSMASLLMRAYGVKQQDLIAPDWASTERFAVRAKIPEGVSADRVPEMLQAMLGERLHIRVHEEHREIDGYALRVDAGGLKVKPAGPAPDTSAATADKPAMAMTQDGKGGMSLTAPGMGTIRSSSIEGNPMLGTHLEVPRTTMHALAAMAGRYAGRPVVDETGLEGAYAVTLDVSMADVFRAGGRGVPPSLDDAGGPDLLSSLRKQGLVLKARKVPVDVLVVDHLDKVPTEN